MTLTLADLRSATPHLSRAIDVRLVPAAPALWRVVDRSGRVIGHLQAVREGADVRYRARRFHAPSRGRSATWASSGRPTTPSTA